MVRPGLRGTALLFAGSFLVALLILTLGGNPSRVAAPSATLVTWPEAHASRMPELTVQTTAAALPPAATEDSADIPDIATAKVAATMALDAEDRILAIQVLSDDSSRESFDTLLTAVTAAADPRERATAISSLRQRQRDDGDDVRIRNAMQAATYDSDPLVVVMAQSVLKEFEPER